MTFAELDVRLVDQGTDWSSWLTAGATVVTTVIVFATAVLALRGLKDARQTRHAQLVAELSRRWDEPAVRESIALFREYGPHGTIQLIETLWGPGVHTRDPADLADWYKMSIYPNLIETFGVLLSEGFISEDVAYKLSSEGIIGAWEDWRRPVLRLRELTGSREVWRYFEYIATVLKDRRQLAPARTRFQRIRRFLGTG